MRVYIRSPAWRWIIDTSPLYAARRGVIVTGRLIPAKKNVSGSGRSYSDFLRGVSGRTVASNEPLGPFVFFTVAHALERRQRRVGVSER